MGRLDIPVLMGNLATRRSELARCRIVAGEKMKYLKEGFELEINAKTLCLRREILPDQTRKRVNFITSTAGGYPTTDDSLYQISTLATFRRAQSH